MRGAVLIMILVAMTLVPSVASSGSLDKPALVYATTDTHGDTIVGWTPVPFAISYFVYKGPDADHLVLLEDVHDIFYQDSSPQTDDIVYYGIAANFGDHQSPNSIVQSGTSQNNDCVSMSGNNPNVYTQNCVGHA